MPIFIYLAHALSLNRDFFAPLNYSNQMILLAASKGTQVQTAQRLSAYGQDTVLHAAAHLLLCFFKLLRRNTIYDKSVENNNYYFFRLLFTRCYQKLIIM